MLQLIQNAGWRVLGQIESLFNLAFTSNWNPFHHLGALAFYFFWIDAISGLYLYIIFDTSVYGAYESVEWLTYEQWYLGGIMRSLHRYSSDAMVITVILHLSREFFLDRHRTFRWFSWVSGVPLLWLLFASGINGYWLVWDRLAQFVAVNTAEWLDWLPVFSGGMARNFLNQAELSDRFFSLLVFLHIGIPLVLLLGMWIHIQRITRAKVNPPLSLMVGSLGALLLLSVIKPALSQGGQADLDTVVATANLDWFYLYIYPLIDLSSPKSVWFLLTGLTLLLGVLPWLPPMRRAPPAVVNLANCNGCERCFADCPYAAVIMQPRSDGLPFRQEAVVVDDLCAACGICVGACPTATPFRRASELVPGIDLPARKAISLRDDLVAAGEGAPQSGDRVIVFGCDFGPALEAVTAPGVTALQLPCIGALPPSFIDFAITRGHADGVFLTGCQRSDCRYRLGIDWTEQRLAGERDPHLRARVPRERVASLWCGRDGGAALAREIAAFQRRLRDLGPYRRTHPGRRRRQPAAEATTTAETRT